MACTLRKPAPDRLRQAQQGVPERDDVSALHLGSGCPWPPPLDSAANERTPTVAPGCNGLGPAPRRRLLPAEPPARTGSKSKGRKAFAQLRRARPRFLIRSGGSDAPGRRRLARQQGRRRPRLGPPAQESRRVRCPPGRDRPAADGAAASRPACFRWSHAGQGSLANVSRRRWRPELAVDR